MQDQWPGSCKVRVFGILQAWLYVLSRSHRSSVWRYPMRHSNVPSAAGRTPRFLPGMIARVVCRWMPAVCAVVLIGVMVSGGSTSYGAPTGTELPALEIEEAGRTIFLPLVTADPRLTPEQAAEYVADNTYTDPKFLLPPDDPLRDHIQETAAHAFEFITELNVIDITKQAAPERFRDYVGIGDIRVGLYVTDSMIVQVPIMTLPAGERLTHEEYVAIGRAVLNMEEERYGSVNGFYKKTGFLPQFDILSNSEVQYLMLGFASPPIDNAQEYERLMLDDRGRLIIEDVDLPGPIEKN